MEHRLHLQSQLSISIQGVEGQFVDVTEYVDWGVEYEEQADMIRALRFTIGKYAETFLERLHQGQRVICTAGTLTKFKRIFDGTVTRISTSFPDDGAIKVRLECLSTAWTALGRHIARYNVYPDPKSTRSFAAGKSSLKVSEIVRGIIQENNMQEGEIDIPEDKVYSLKDAFHQVGGSDWGVLTRLAKAVACTVWTEFVGDSEQLFFVDRSKVRKQPDPRDISFVYALRLKGNEQEFTLKSLEPNQRLLRNVTVNEDVAAANSISYAASRFDFEKGEEVSLMGEYITEADGKRTLVFYELDEDKVSKLEQTNPGKARQLRNMGMFNIPWEIAKEFYRPVEIVDEDVAIYDQAFFGITVNCTTNGDVDIRSQRAYTLYGIARYSSKALSDRYWLHSLKHRWDEDGFYTDMEFKK